jgi:hypothetical protein
MLWHFLVLSPSSISHILNQPHTPTCLTKTFQMPNVSFDIFYDLDFINITATRSGAAPKAKPAWKVRTAPKLPPKELPTSKASPRPESRPKINAQRNALNEKQAPAAKKAPPKLSSRIQEVESSDGDSVTSNPPKRAPPKLKDLPKKN